MTDTSLMNFIKKHTIAVNWFVLFKIGWCSFNHYIFWERPEYILIRYKSVKGLQYMFKLPENIEHYM